MREATHDERILIIHHLEHGEVFRKSQIVLDWCIALRRIGFGAGIRVLDWSRGIVSLLTFIAGMYLAIDGLLIHIQDASNGSKIGHRMCESLKVKGRKGPPPERPTHDEKKIVTHLGSILSRVMACRTASFDRPILIIL
jgi:hypothetical protein